MAKIYYFRTSPKVIDWGWQWQVEGKKILTDRKEIDYFSSQTTRMDGTEGIRMSEQSTAWLLKVLAGPQMGAELLLQPGNYSLGRGDGNDIMLNDVLVPASFGRLTVGREGIWLEAGEKQADDVKRQIALYEPFQVGGSVLCVGRPEESWPVEQIQTWMVSVSSREQEEGAPDGPVASGWRGRLPFKLPGAVDSKALWYGAGIAGMVLMAVGGLVLMESSEAASPLAVAQSLEVSAVEISRHLAEAGWGNLQVTAREGSIVVRGDVSDDETLRRLTRQLAPYGAGVAVEVRCRERIEAAAEAVLAALGRDSMTVRYVGDGVLAVRGYGGAKDDWARIRQMVLSDVDVVESLDDRQVETLGERLEAAGQRLAAAGLESMVRVRAEGETVLVEGSLVERNWRRLRDALAPLQAKWRNGLRLAVTHLDDTLELAINGVAMAGEHRIVVSRSGAFYREGDRLPGGFVVERIEPKRVWFRRNHQSVVRDLTLLDLGEAS